MKKNIIAIILVACLIACLLTGCGSKNENQDVEQNQTSNENKNEMISKLTDEYSLIDENGMIIEGTKTNNITYVSNYVSKVNRANALYSEYKSRLEQKGIKTYTEEDVIPSLNELVLVNGAYYVPCYAHFSNMYANSGFVDYGVLKKTADDQVHESDMENSPEVPFQLHTVWTLEMFNQIVGEWKHEDGLEKALELHKYSFDNNIYASYDIVEYELTIGDTKEYSLHLGAKFEGYIIYEMKVKAETIQKKVNVYGVIIEGSDAPNIIAFCDPTGKEEELMQYYKKQLDNVLELYWEPDVWLGKTKLSWK